MDCLSICPSCFFLNHSQCSTATLHSGDRCKLVVNETFGESWVYACYMFLFENHIISSHCHAVIELDAGV